jgi:hypothetical protein
MGLVDYPSSPESSDGNEDLNSSLPPAPSHNINQDNDEDDSRPIKKRKTSPSLTTTKSSPATTSLPALPATFRDLYSSTVRTTVQDNPALHAGRQRATPHIVGNWPAHISLECKRAKHTLSNPFPRRIPIIDRAFPRLILYTKGTLRPPPSPSFTPSRNPPSNKPQIRLLPIKCPLYIASSKTPSPSLYRCTSPSPAP